MNEFGMHFKNITPLIGACVVSAAPTRGKFIYNTGNSAWSMQQMFIFRVTMLSAGHSGASSCVLALFFVGALCIHSSVPLCRPALSNTLLIYLTAC